MFLSRHLFLLASLAAAVVIPASATPVNLVTNGGFEDGNLIGWSQSGTVGGAFVVPMSLTTANGCYQGNRCAALGPYGSDGYLSQNNLATKAGDRYDFSFALLSDGSKPNDFSAYWDGSNLFSGTNLPDNGWQLYTFEETARGNDSLKFGFRNDFGYMYLDDASVTAVPEPSTLALLGSGLLGIAGVVRRRLVA